MWNNRYAEEEFAFGKEPNDFLASLDLSNYEGSVLCLAEGQGRNAVYLASKGLAVTAVDLSEVGLHRTQELATERNVAVETVQADLGTFKIPPASADGIVMIFGHTPPEVRTHIHLQIIRGLRPGGFFILEGYNLGQLEFRTGGPKTEALLYSLDEIKREFEGYMDWQIAQDTVRDIQEGKYHTGKSSVIQLFGVRTVKRSVR